MVILKFPMDLTDFDTTLAYLQASVANGNGRSILHSKIFGNEDSTQQQTLKCGYGFNIKQDEKSHEFTIEFENKVLNSIKTFVSLENVRTWEFLDWYSVYWWVKNKYWIEGFECTFMANQVKVGVLGGDLKYTKSTIRRPKCIRR